MSCVKHTDHHDHQKIERRIFSLGGLKLYTHKGNEYTKYIERKHIMHDGDMIFDHPHDNTEAGKTPAAQKNGHFAPIFTALVALRDRLHLKPSTNR